MKTGKDFGFYANFADFVSAPAGGTLRGLTQGTQRPQRGAKNPVNPVNPVGKNGRVEGVVF